MHLSGVFWVFSGEHAGPVGPLVEVYAYLCDELVLVSCNFNNSLLC